MAEIEYRAKSAEGKSASPVLQRHQEGRMKPRQSLELKSMWQRSTPPSPQSCTMVCATRLRPGQEKKLLTIGKMPCPVRTAPSNGGILYSMVGAASSVDKRC
jgi:hypothetical protein